MESIKTLHVVGYKNSGKTTLLKRWIKRLKEHNYTVSVMKHHGHKSRLAMPEEAKDSMQYLKMGADASFVSGGGFTQQIYQTEMDYGSLKRYASIQKPDIILVEGYKKIHCPKVVLVRQPSDWKTLKNLSEIALVVGDVDQSIYEQITSREDQAAIDAWLLNWIKQGAEG